MPALLPLPGKVEEELGSWGQGEGPEAEAQGKVTTATVHLAFLLFFSITSLTFTYFCEQSILLVFFLQTLPF